MSNKKSTHDDKLKLIVIKTKSRVYVSDNINNGSYHYTKIKELIFDGVKPVPTFKADWFEIKEVPELIQKKLPSERINTRYELKEAHYSTGLPKVLRSQDFSEEGQYESVYGLYDLRYELTEPKLVEVEFELNVIVEDSDFEIVRSDYNLQHSVLDQIITHPVLLSTRPCTLSRQESYNIVRKYIKANIDPRWATITSDYDFCFTVSKNIEHEPEEYRVNVGKRKPKYETRYTRSRTVKVYETSPKSYDRYPVIEPFAGKNEEDLKQNIQKFLDGLMKVINKPLIECEHCKGYGVSNYEV
ncbi:hypothetical protein G9G63_09370 [Paenibacillus sp. EKM202P]|uniref:hypothetical protein n=1 Tax=unclassified Paenibacillus TaxID=185978 RepID=UPI0013EAA2EF|nr:MULTISPECIES: hypothetical protein [unclassified Paenibacillus]KAF6565358.1 hypothetical protein G9G63_09370 [Paenibacillus sp. EKM202P]KAF6569317.1 hypothetical protein G9G64_12725 [Paenibacillus sp. EKM207P]